MSSYIIPSPLGNLCLLIESNTLKSIQYAPIDSQLSQVIAPYALIVQHELEQYFCDPNHVFSIQLEPEGTAFQKKVWRALQQIPTCTTVSYKDISEKLTTSPRAVGNACRANPIPIIIPCHRVVAKNTLGGYVGQTTGAMIDIKKWLLNHEVPCLSKHGTLLTYFD
ncbi:MAG: methylated-DNA--[protein]-cysteine S-methyltransferase [Gammaproteobacteria bacterium]|nr:methylated-DNA--[protein]-cysteine S-methyltransferase [Gammaproteobacteria bacterium]